MFGPHVDRQWVRREKSDAPHRARPDIADHIVSARAHGRRCGLRLEAFQIFVAGPRQAKITLEDDEADRLRAFLDESRALGSPTWVVAHGTYLDNPWGGKIFAAKFIRKQVKLCLRAGISGLVVHLGVPGVEQVAPILPSLVVPEAAGQTRIYLEVPHVLPRNSHYETGGKLGGLFARVREIDPELKSFGLCVDTAHLWSCGVDLTTYEQGAQWLDGLRQSGIPPGATMFHINDSVSGLASGQDKHAPLTMGNIWRDHQYAPRASGLAAFIEYIIEHNCPAILERSSMAQGNSDPRAALCMDYFILSQLDPSLHN